MIENEGGETRNRHAASCDSCTTQQVAQPFHCVCMSRKAGKGEAEVIRRRKATGGEGGEGQQMSKDEGASKRSITVCGNTDENTMQPNPVAAFVFSP